jgi:ubiquinone/menaquinone biosynthesis C-methylase UbiE
MKLDLACGLNKHEGFLGVDIVPLPGVDIVWDLENYPWPFDDNSIDEIYCSHYIEHTKDLIKFMDEVWRICKPGAPVTIIAPYYSSIWAWRDPTHVRAISEETFLYFTKTFRETHGLAHMPIKSNYEILEVIFALDNDFANKSEEELRFAIRHYINVVMEIKVVLKVVK